MGSRSVETFGERGTGFSHEALLYVGDEGFLERTVGFVEDGVAASEPVQVAVGVDKIELLRGRLGELADRVRFVDMATVGPNPARIMPAWRGFVDEYPVGRPLRGIGEPVWPGRSADELAECDRSEALVNLAFADSKLWVLCAYDVSALDPDTIRTAQRNHPLIDDSGSSRPSPTFPGTFELSRPFDAPLSEAPAGATELSFDDSGLSSVRAWIAAEATALGLSHAKVDEFVLGVGEIATNSIRHGGGNGTARLWSHDGVLVCEVSDQGSIEDPMVGRRKPSLEREGGLGVWIANQLCDLVQIRSFPAGSVVRLHMRLDR